ncbi:hypothetical protein R5R35_009731 [Gryllus longicercus]|uniref:Kazal-like domain-containing protein n=1 Tax=Gryllus longicercus TaxID=2509291 RepID=A0AAN9VX38_9ORTH
MRAAVATAALAALAALASCRSPPKCDCQCDLKYDPVCAVDSKGIEETYPNKCSFECFKCTFSKTDLVIRTRGECPPRRPPSRSEKRKPETRQSNAIHTSPPKCNCNCPYSNAPLCAIDAKGVTDTYPNQCAFDCYKCTHGKDLRVRSQGECPPNPPTRPTPGGRQKPDAETTVQKPGRNGQCNCRCTFEYKPVCAGDSKGVKETYPSACAFECYKCTHGKDLQILNQGECSEKPPPNRPSPNQTGKCNCQCPLNYDPVCAADSRGNEETYPNACSFECYKCTHRKESRIVKQGECSNKATARPPRPRPPGKPRPSIRTRNCDCVCLANYVPVCAVNSKGAEMTFSNRCKLKCENCKNNEDYVVRRDGECRSNSSRNPPRSKTRTA